MLPISLSAFSAESELDSSRLWLPVKYQKQFLQLKQAAQAAFELERCVSVLSGTIDLGQSTEKNPIYRILCRQPSGRTYNELVDGLTFETLTTPPVVEVILTPEEIEAQRLAEERRLEQEREQLKHAFWRACLNELEVKTRLMDAVSHRFSEEAKPLYFDEERAEFVMNFDAKDISGNNLRYTATCHANKESTRLKIKPRGTE